jgi:hypothetical protein
MPNHEAVKAAWLAISPIICQVWGCHHNVDIWVGGNCFAFSNQEKERYIFGLILVCYVKASWFQSSRLDGWFPWILNNIPSWIYKIPTKFMTSWCTFVKAVQLLYWDCLVKCQLRVLRPVGCHLKKALFSNNKIGDEVGSGISDSDVVLNFENMCQVCNLFIFILVICM